ncbi:hypothetical protein C475_19738 [Halosimplex carlsbadense 2-9-1]|uniref:DUF3006 domain-containing protein n=1 Tax=Halosimplex carlsbadense 2-9-1 TaxID=797114 RepID=M0CC96_9EURY|nr:DUF3006 domain-containing protein [Halosimplex carlsbadense]ELZ20865.1 hypothetical protein C475_19738 [Halosimplex carlsbadense 2-9-1]
MIPDGTYTAVVDRIEDSLATLEVDGEDELYELTVDERDLPGPAGHADAILEIALVDGTLVGVDYDRQATEERNRQAQDRFDQLSQRPPRDDDADDSR